MYSKGSSHAQMNSSPIIRLFDYHINLFSQNLPSVARLRNTKGQLISKCLFGVFKLVCSKIEYVSAKNV